MSKALTEMSRALTIVMMRPRLLVLLLPLFACLGATCITSVEQKGPEGPWVGEVVNTGPDAVHEIGISADIFDATGRRLGPFIVPTCPASLLPGQKGTFELFFRSPHPVVLPLRAEFRNPPPSTTGLGDWGDGAGLSVRLLQKYPEHRAVLGEVRNDSERTYSVLTVCGNLRTPDGKLVEVGNATPFPYLIRPGETRTFSMFFNSMPEGDFEFFARGASRCCDNQLILDPALFHISATRVVEGPSGREMQVVGELRNVAGQDLSWVELQAYIQDSPWARVRAEVGCPGYVGFGTTGPAMFTLPLEQNVDPEVVLAGIVGHGSSGGWRSVQARDVWKQSTPGSRLVKVGATLTNPTSTWLRLNGVSLNLRAADNSLAGTLCLEVDEDIAWSDAYLAPGASMSISGEVIEVGAATSAEVVAYAEPTSGPPPTRGPIGY